MRQVIAVFLLASSAVVFADTPTLEVTGGAIRGIEEGSMRIYKGIPYAAPPVDELRWRDPQAVIPWDGVRDCTEFGPKCPQPPYPAGSFYERPLGTTSEDCLYLNVWTTAQAEDRRPVMVWIHGGALTRGAGDIPAYDGAALARQGIVMVTINYRLGAFGFLAHPKLTAESMHTSSGNFGILDQIAALQWVQNNIERFGGDPSRVTIFGESAGSWSVCYLQATPLSKGLFQRAIGESGGVFDVMPYRNYGRYGQASAESMGQGFLTTLSGNPNDLDAARAKTADEVIAAFSSHRGSTWRPNVDGYAFRDDVYTIFAEGRQHDVPVIVGSNADEGTSLLGGRYPQSVGAMREIVEGQFGEHADRLLEVYSAANDAEAPAAYLALFRDQVFTWQMRTWARMMENVSSEAYQYYFSHVPSRPDKEKWGAYHAAEIIYAFRNLHTTSYPNLQEDYRVSDAVSNYWINFAATGDPNGAGAPEWPPYTSSYEPYMEFAEGAGLGHHLLAEELDALEAYFLDRRSK